MLQHFLVSARIFDGARPQDSRGHPILAGFPQGWDEFGDFGLGIHFSAP